MKTVVKIVAVILVTASALTDALAGDADLVFNDISIRIRPSAKYINPDPEAVTEPDGSILYKRKGLINKIENNTASGEKINQLVRRFFADVAQAVSTGDVNQVVSLFDSESALVLKPQLMNPSFAESYLAALAGIHGFEWKFAVQTENGLVVFTKLNPGAETESLVPFFFSQKDGKFVPVYKVGLDRMFTNIIMASQEKALEVSE